MIFQRWPQWFRDLYGGAWPTSYLAFDTETTGLSRTRDLVVEIGYCLVQDCQVVEHQAFYIDWTLDGLVPESEMRERIDQVTRDMAEAGRTCHTSFDALKQYGNSAAPVFQCIKEVMESRDCLRVAHNGIRFDVPIMASSFDRAGVVPIRFTENSLLDTQAVEKANQMHDQLRVHPRANDTLQSWATRVIDIRAHGVYTNLDRHCYAKYEFEKAGVAKESMHGTFSDTYGLHLLMEAWRGPASLPMVAVAPAARPLSELLPAPSRPAPPAAAPLPAPAARLPDVFRRKQRNH